MKNSTKIIAAIIAIVTTILQIPAIQSAFFALISAHPAVAAIIGGLSSIFVLLHVPTKTPAKLLLLAFAVFLIPALSHAQATPIQNLYGAGLSVNQSANPPISGTALYAHEIGSSNTYAFTAIDALSNSTRPFTISTNIGAGVAQKITTIDKLPIFVPTATGVSFGGSNFGWQWNTGIATLIPIKKSSDFYVMPTLRFLKSSVSNGSGYQPIIGVEFCWAK